MSRSQDRYYADAPHTGGFSMFGVVDLNVLSTGTLPALTRNAQGDYSLNRTAAGAETITLIGTISHLRRPVAEAVAIQQQFGGTVGPMPAPGRPPFTGASQLTPPTGAQNKDIYVDDMVFAYNIGVAALTSITPKVSLVTHVNNAATPTIVNQPLAASPVLPVAFRANDYVTVVPFITPVQAVADLTEINFEVIIVMASTGTLKFRGVGFHFRFNYN